MWVIIYYQEVIFVLRPFAKLSQKPGPSAARKPRDEADDHKTPLGSACAMFTFTTKNPRYDVFTLMIIERQRSTGLCQ